MTLADAGLATEPRGSHDATIVLRATGEVIGWIGIGGTIDRGAGDLVMGHAPGRALWGKGCMTEALNAVLAFGVHSARREDDLRAVLRRVADGMTRECHLKLSETQETGGYGVSGRPLIRDFVAGGTVLRFASGAPTPR